MRVTHVVENLNRGGLERVVVDLLRAQCAAGWRCEVLCVHGAGALAAEAAALGVPLHVCGKRDGVDLAALRRLRAILRRVRPQVLHTHNPLAQYYARVAALGLHIGCTVNTRHGMGDVDGAARREWLFRRSLRRDTAVVAVSRSAGEEVLRRGGVRPGQLRVVPNGIAVERFAARNEAARERLCGTLGVAPTMRIVGTIGRLNWAKDHATLIEAFNRLAAQRADCVLVVVGGGELDGQVRRLIEASPWPQRVFLLGDRSDVPELLQGFDLFALSSVSEGYSIALLEACAAALPIVATDVGGNGEIVDHGRNGLLVPKQSAAAMATALGGLLADPGRAQQMGVAGRDWVEREGSLQRMAQRYAEVYAAFGR